MTITNHSIISSTQAITAVQNWLQKVVIGLNFCPFAKREWMNNRIHFVTCQASSISIALDTLLDEMYSLEGHSEYETSLLIFTEGFSDFTDYLDLLDSANVLLEQAGYQGIFQLASFHPEYLFEGEPANAPGHYTNRSPLPILHVLREASLSRVLNTYPNPEQIPLNNIEKAKHVGAQQLQKLIGDMIVR